LVLHHHLLAELVAEVLGGKPRHHVDATPRRQRNDELDRPLGQASCAGSEPHAAAISASAPKERAKDSAPRARAARDSCPSSSSRAAAADFAGPPSCAALVVAEACAKCLPGVRALATIVAGSGHSPPRLPVSID